MLIYNTQDPSTTAGYGALGQVILNAGGTVSLGPQASGRTRTLTASTITCNGEKLSSPALQAELDESDILIRNMATTGVNGALGSVVSGTANLAAMTSCILIDSGDSTFAYNPAGLLGNGVTLQQQWG